MAGDVIPARAGIRTALVTGASGFVGSHLVEQLLADGVEVRCLLRAGSSARWLPHSEQLQLRRGSLQDRGDLERLLEGVDAVFHLAAITSAPREADYIAANVEGTRNLVLATQRAARDAAFVLCSTQAAAGPSRGGRPVTEADEPRPISPYGRSKLAAEKVVLESSLHSVVLRAPAVYGPRDRDILEMFRWAARGLSPVVGRGEQKLSMVHVRDLAAALAGAAGGASRRTYYVTDGRVHNRSELVEWIAEAVERAARRIHIPVGLALTMAHAYSVAARVSGIKPLLTPGRIREMCEPAWTCDDSLARQELGYVSKIQIREGLSETAKWYRDQGWI